MCKPRTTSPVITWWEDEDRLQRLAQYCAQDVLTTRELHKVTRPLSSKERDIWLLDSEINARGYGLDLAAAQGAMRFVDAEKHDIDLRARAITDGAVKNVMSYAVVLAWLKKHCGIELPNLRADTVEECLEQEGLYKSGRLLLELRQFAAKSSTAKVKRMIQRVSSDQRIRHTLQYYGAAQTGRWAARDVQPHNMPRPRPEIKQEQINAFLEGLTRPEGPDLYWGKPDLKLLADSLRGMIIPAPGYSFVSADFTAIEARVLPWLAGDVERLNDIRNGVKLYETLAAKVFSVPIDSVNSDQRQVGKVGELALGYGGGAGALGAMARAYRIKISIELGAKIKAVWRESRPKIVEWWETLDAAAKSAMVNSGKVVRAGPHTRFCRKGSTLYCQLPSGRLLCYPFAKLEMLKEPFIHEGVTYYAQKLGKWRKVSTYGGKLAENITQAVARDILAEAMLRLNSKGFMIVLHVHDEIVCEVGDINLETDKTEILDTVTELPYWAEVEPALPISAKIWAGKRYRK